MAHYEVLAAYMADTLTQEAEIRNPLTGSTPERDMDHYGSIEAARADFREKVVSITADISSRKTLTSLSPDALGSLRQERVDLLAYWEKFEEKFAESGTGGRNGYERFMQETTAGAHIGASLASGYALTPREQKELGGFWKDLSYKINGDPEAPKYRDRILAGATADDSIALGGAIAMAVNGVVNPDIKAYSERLGEIQSVVVKKSNAGFGEKGVEKAAEDITAKVREKVSQTLADGRPVLVDPEVGAFMLMRDGNRTRIGLQEAEAILGVPGVIGADADLLADVYQAKQGQMATRDRKADMDILLSPAEKRSLDYYDDLRSSSRAVPQWEIDIIHGIADKLNTFSGISGASDVASSPSNPENTPALTAAGKAVRSPGG